MAPSEWSHSDEGSRERAPRRCDRTAAAMPHAINDVTMADLEEDSAAQRYMDENGGVEAAASAFANREIDQRDKAEDAVDYEDISDLDDLPDEEVAAHHLEDDDADGFSNGDVNGATQTNGYHDIQEPASDDLFGNGESNDLFGERTSSSPEQVRQHPEHIQPQHQRRPGGLALPSKSGLALPNPNAPPSHVRQPPCQPQYHHQPVSSLSPPAYQSDEYSPAASPGLISGVEESSGAEETQEQAQARLFRNAKRRQAGEEVAEERQEVDPAVFYSLFPDYEKDQNPRFIEYFPQRPVKFRGKVPAKPPKAVQPTKLSLDLLPDQERSFKSFAAAGRNVQDWTYQSNLVSFSRATAAEDESDDDLALSADDEAEPLAGMTLADLAMICESWEMDSLDALSAPDDVDEDMEGEWDVEERSRPSKKRKTDILSNMPLSFDESRLHFEDPERAAAKLAKRVTLDLNDPNLLIDEHAPQVARKVKRIPGDIRRDPTLARDLARRYNISNDEAYDLLKENHQHKVRSTLGNAAAEHALPATKLQFPFYKLALDPKSKRAFHRPALHLKEWEIKPQKEFRIGKLKTIKRKERRGREIKELFATAESLAFNDNSNMLLLEYSEEAPTMLSNFGMGNRLINFYRKRNADDQERPKRDIGETQVLLTQDKSPFGNFGHVDQGEVVPTIQNGLFRSPVFQHQTKPTDFLVAVSSTHEYGSRMYLRNIENLHTVGQQFPVSEVPGEHSRRVTDAAKKRLRALAYRIYTKTQNPMRRDKVLDNATLMKHLKGHDMPQTRSKMREFMKYDSKPKGAHDAGVWLPMPGQVVPDAETLRSWVKPEDVCLLDSMQVGVQRLNDLGLAGNKDDEDKDIDENANIELQLAPWRSTKAFIQATQGKAMLKLHGEGDPTGRGEAFSFVKTSMKGGFQAIGESVEDKLDAKRRRENGGHTYNVAKQQKAYDDYIRMIWEKQKNSLASNMELSDTEMDDAPDDEPESAFGRAGTPRSSFVGTPIGNGRRGDDETGTQFSKASADRGNGKVLILRRTGGRDAYGQETDAIEKITNPKVIAAYKARRAKKRLESVSVPLHACFPHFMPSLTSSQYRYHGLPVHWRGPGARSACEAILRRRARSHPAQRRTPRSSRATKGQTSWHHWRCGLATCFHGRQSRPFGR